MDLDVRSFFDSVPRDLMLKAVARHAKSAILAWARRTRVRRTVLGTALVATVAVNALLMLPLVPAGVLARTRSRR